MVFTSLLKVLRHYQPVLVAVESPGGAQSFTGAKSIHRAQQATLDAVWVYMNALPVFISYAQVQKRAVGAKKVSKDQMREAMEKRWPTAKLDKLLKQRPIYAEEGQRPPPPSKWDNAFDAAAVIHGVWNEPAVAMLRQMC